MKYDCEKTRDFMHEWIRYHKASGNDKFPIITSWEPASIEVLQMWSDEHPEPPKLTKREYEFLTVFVPCFESKAIERTTEGLYIVFHRAFNDESDGYSIDSNLFPFISEGEEWYFDKLLGLEVEE